MGGNLGPGIYKNLFIITNFYIIHILSPHVAA